MKATAERIAGRREYHVRVSIVVVDFLNIF
jgi:hypothetical protein